MIEFGLSALPTKNSRVAITTLEKVRSLKETLLQRPGLQISGKLTGRRDKIKAAEVLNEYVKIPGITRMHSYKTVVYETINASEAVNMYKENSRKAAN